MARFQRRRGVPVAEDASLPTGTAQNTAGPRKRRTRGPISPALGIAVAVIYPVSALLFRLRYRHADRIPPAGPVLLVVNHVSILDPLGCARLVWDNGRVPHFLAKESLFRGPGSRLLRGAGQIPVARFSADAHEALRAAEAALAGGHVVVIYPEGSVTRDPDWWPMEARTGVARLALTSDAVVLPVAQWGAQRAHDYHAKTFRPRLRTPVDYLVGEPVDLSARRRRLRAGEPLSGELLRETTDLIMGRVRNQLGELRGESPPLAFHPRPRQELPGDVSGSAA